MKKHLKRFGIGFAIVAGMHIIYSAYARGVVNLTACLCCGVAGGILLVLGCAQYEKKTNEQDKFASSNNSNKKEKEEKDNK